MDVAQQRAPLTGGNLSTLSKRPGRETVVEYIVDQAQHLHGKVCESIKVLAPLKNQSCRFDEIDSVDSDDGGVAYDERPLSPVLEPSRKRTEMRKSNLDLYWAGDAEVAKRQEERKKRRRELGKNRGKTYGREEKTPERINKKKREAVKDKTKTKASQYRQSSKEKEPKKAEQSDLKMMGATLLAKNLLDVLPRSDRLGEGRMTNAAPRCGFMCKTKSSEEATLSYKTGKRNSRKGVPELTFSNMDFLKDLAHTRVDALPSACLEQDDDNGEKEKWDKSQVARQLLEEAMLGALERLQGTNSAKCLRLLHSSEDVTAKEAREETSPFNQELSHFTKTNAASDEESCIRSEYSQTWDEKRQGKRWREEKRNAQDVEINEKPRKQEKWEKSKSVVMDVCDKEWAHDGRSLREASQGRSDQDDRFLACHSNVGAASLASLSTHSASSVPVHVDQPEIPILAFGRHGSQQPVNSWRANHGTNARELWLIRERERAIKLDLGFQPAIQGVSPITIQQRATMADCKEIGEEALERKGVEEGRLAHMYENGYDGSVNSAPQQSDNTTREAREHSLLEKPLQEERGLEVEGHKDTPLKDPHRYIDQCSAVAAPPRFRVTPDLFNHHLFRPQGEENHLAVQTENGRHDEEPSYDLVEDKSFDYVDGEGEWYEGPYRVPAATPSCFHDRFRVDNFNLVTYQDHERGSQNGDLHTPVWLQPGLARTYHEKPELLLQEGQLRGFWQPHRY